MLDPAYIPQIQWPRQHVIKWKFPLRAKRYYFSLDEALESKERNTAGSAYYDNFCGMWHIGTWREPRDSPEKVNGAVP